MATDGLKFWGIPLALWGFYCCWYFGYQSGYADGHSTAWSMSRPSVVTQYMARVEEQPDR